MSLQFGYFMHVLKLGSEINFLIGDWELQMVEKWNSIYTCKGVKGANGTKVLQCVDQFENKPIGNYIYWNNSISKFVFDSDVGVPSIDKHQSPLIIWYFDDIHYTIWKKIGIITYRC